MQSTERMESVEKLEESVEKSEDPVEQSTENSPEKSTSDPANNASATQAANAGTEIKRRATPGEEAEQLSKLLSHAVSQQFIVLRRLRKVLDTVCLLSPSHT